MEEKYNIIDNYYSEYTLLNTCFQKEEIKKRVNLIDAKLLN